MARVLIVGLVVLLSVLLSPVLEGHDSGFMSRLLRITHHSSRITDHALLAAEPLERHL